MDDKSASGEVRLLRFLVQNRLLGPDAIAAAKSAIGEQRQGSSLIVWLAQSGHMEETELAQALAELLRLPYGDVSTFVLDPAMSKLVKQDLAFRYQVLPIREDESSLEVAITNPVDQEALRALEFATNRRVRMGVITTPTAMRKALDNLYAVDDGLATYLEDVPEKFVAPLAALRSAESQEQLDDLETLKRDAELPPIIRLLNMILLQGIRDGASDIHIEPKADEVVVRYRFDGLLRESARLPKWVQQSLVARCKVVARLDITERRVPQDGAIRVYCRGSQVELRVSTLPAQYGESVVMRILGSANAPERLEALSLSPRDLACVRRAISRPQGIVLVTGPTGSGKSTTLYNMLAALRSPTRKIITAEDPVERRMEWATQVEVNEKQGLTFAILLRSILRQDPDTILVGEIRDNETAALAFRAAQTGHLVLSTLHTNDTVSTVSRLIDLGVERYVLPSSLNLILAQRLVRRVCDHCAQPYEPDSKLMSSLPVVPGTAQLRRGTGCEMCHRSGFSGRFAVFEVMPITPQLAQLIGAGASENMLRQRARQDGMRPLLEDATARMLAGMTTPEEVLRIVDIDEHENRCPNCRYVVEQDFLLCPNCSSPLRDQCVGCGMELRSAWHVCPYCGERRSELLGE